MTEEGDAATVVVVRGLRYGCPHCKSMLLRLKGHRLPRHAAGLRTAPPPGEPACPGSGMCVQSASEATSSKRAEQRQTREAAQAAAAAKREAMTPLRQKHEDTFAAFREFTEPITRAEIAAARLAQCHVKTDGLPVLDLRKGHHRTERYPSALPSVSIGVDTQVVAWATDPHGSYPGWGLCASTVTHVRTEDMPKMGQMNFVPKMVSYTAVMLFAPPDGPVLDVDLDDAAPTFSVVNPPWVSGWRVGHSNATLVSPRPARPELVSTLPFRYVLPFTPGIDTEPVAMVLLPGTGVAGITHAYFVKWLPGIAEAVFKDRHSPDFPVRPLARPTKERDRAGRWADRQRVGAERLCSLVNAVLDPDEWYPGAAGDSEQTDAERTDTDWQRLVQWSSWGADSETVAARIETLWGGPEAMESLALFADPANLDDFTAVAEWYYRMVGRASYLHEVDWQLTVLRQEGCPVGEAEAWLDGRDHLG